MNKCVMLIFRVLLLATNGRIIPDQGLSLIIIHRYLLGGIYAVDVDCVCLINLSVLASMII